MSDCPGLHCPGCRGKSGVLALAAIGAAVAVIVEFLTEILIAAGTVVGLALAVAVVVLTRMKRRGQLALRPDGLWRPDAVRPVSPAAPIAARPARALPAPQTVNNYFFSATPEQMAEVVRRQSIEGR